MQMRQCPVARIVNEAALAGEMNRRRDFVCLGEFDGSVRRVRRLLVGVWTPPQIDRSCYPLVDLCCLYNRPAFSHRKGLRGRREICGTDLASLNDRRRQPAVDRSAVLRSLEQKSGQMEF